MLSLCFKGVKMRFPRIRKVNAFTLRRGDIFSKTHKKDIIYKVLRAQISDKGLILDVQNLKTLKKKQICFSSRQRKVVVEQRKHYPRGYMKAQPFIKWVGGKRQLLPQLFEYLPNPMPTKYAELFLGGGAMFWDLSQRFDFEQIILNDSNYRLREAYIVIWYRPSEITQRLKLFESIYLNKNEEEKESFYYQCRERFNSLEPGLIERTALLIFLNKTGFNGLYRVNKKDEFNVPHGRYKNPKICDEENLMACSDLLRQLPVTLLKLSYEQINLDLSGFFIYLDPPYKPISKTSNFTGYSGGFDDSDQERLAQKVKQWHEQGAKIMISNSYLPDYFESLYPDFKLIEVKASRAVNSDPSKRGKVSELLMINY